MIPNVCFPCENGTHRNEPHDNRYGPCECLCSQKPVPSGTQDEREREIREQVEAGQLWKVDIKFLLAQLDEARLKRNTFANDHLKRCTIMDCSMCAEAERVLKEGK